MDVEYIREKKENRVFDDKINYFRKFCVIHRLSRYQIFQLNVNKYFKKNIFFTIGNLKITYIKKKYNNDYFQY